MLLFFSVCGFFLLCGLPSLGIFSLLRIIGPLATVSSSCFPSLFLLAESSVSLFLLCSSLRIWVVLRSLCGLLCSLWTYSLVGSSPGGPFSNVSGFSSSCLGVPGGLPHVFFSSPVAFLSSSRVLLRCRGTLCALCFAPFWRLLVALSVFCLLCSFFLLSRFFGYLARPAFVSPCFRSLSYTASSTSSALSSSSVPWRRGLLVCLQLRLRCRLGVLLPCPLLWLLPLRLPSGLHLLLPFCGAVLLLAWFRWGPVVPARLVI